MDNHIAQLVASLAEYYNKTLTTNQFALYVDDYRRSHLSLEEIREAIDRYRTDAENVFFPLPAKIISIAKPINSDMDIARATISNIIRAIGLFGWTNEDRAKTFIGEIGWEVVNRSGGWRVLCSDINEDNRGTLTAQMRDLCLTVIKMSKNGTLKQDFQQLGYNKEILKLSQNILKNI